MSVLQAEQLDGTKEKERLWLWVWEGSCFLSHPLMLCWACSSGKSLHPRSTCRSLAFCMRRCEPTECLTLTYHSYKPQVVMEIHWVAVAAKLQWGEERAKGGGQLARPLLWASALLWPSLLIKRALTKGVCWLRAKSGTEYSNKKEKLERCLPRRASLKAATLKWGQNTRVRNVRFKWLYWLYWTFQKSLNGSLMFSQMFICWNKVCKEL